METHLRVSEMTQRGEIQALEAELAKERQLRQAAEARAEAAEVQLSVTRVRSCEYIAEVADLRNQVDERLRTIIFGLDRICAPPGGSASNVIEMLPPAS